MKSIIASNRTQLRPVTYKEKNDLFSDDRPVPHPGQLARRRGCRRNAPSGTKPARKRPRAVTEHEIQFGTKVYGVRKARGIQRHEFTGYRRFEVESTITAEPR